MHADSWNDHTASFCPVHPFLQTFFSFCHSEFQGVRASLVNWAAHALSKANFEHCGSSLKLVWPWFKFHYISIVMDFQCLFSEWEPLRWNTMKCYRSVCKVITKAGGTVLPLRGCTAKPPRSVKYDQYRWCLRASCHPDPQTSWNMHLYYCCARCHSTLPAVWECPWAHAWGNKCCPRRRFKDTLKTYLPNLPLISCSHLQSSSYGLSAGECRAVLAEKTRCQPWEMCKAKEVTESSSYFKQHWKPSAVEKSGEPANLQSPSHNKIIFIAGTDLYFSSAKWDDIQVCNERT